MTLSDLKDEPLITELRTRGYVVHKPEAQHWMTVTELAAHIGYRVPSLCRAMSRAPKTDPPGLITERGPSGRILRCLPSPEFYAWLGAFPITEPRTTNQEPRT